MRSLSQALGENPFDAEGLLLAVMLTRLQSGDAGVEAFCTEHRRHHGERAELHIAVAEEHFLNQRYRLACDHFARGVAAAPDDRSALRWGQSLMADGRLEEAHAVLSARVSLFPEAGLGVLVCELALGKPSDLQLDIETEDAERLTRPWLDALFASGDPAATDCFMRNSRLVHDVFPWLPAHLRELSAKGPQGAPSAA